MSQFKFNKKQLFKLEPVTKTEVVKKNSVNSLIKKHGIKLSESTTLQYHQSINDKIWMPDNNIRPDVKDKLIQIGYSWVDFCKIDRQKVKDIILTGGNANFNYTDKSDLDVHIIVDHSELGKDQEFIKDYLSDKKALWAVKHPDIRVYGYPVELYAQDVSETPHFGQGVYSLLKGSWIQFPTNLSLNLSDNKEVEADSKSFEDRITEIIKNNGSLESAKQIWDEISHLRASAIKEDGEFAEKNLVFKDLRNLGLLEKLSNYIRFKEDTDFSALETK